MFFALPNFKGAVPSRSLCVLSRLLSGTSCTKVSWSYST